MANDSDKRYGIIDHADKLGDRDRTNPNRVARRGAAHRWYRASTEPASGAPAERDKAKTRG